jgi:hypothetical protein
LGDETINSEGEDTNTQFSFTDSINALNKLRDIGKMMPEGMNEGMKANRPAWEIV